VFVTGIGRSGWTGGGLSFQRLYFPCGGRERVATLAASDQCQQGVAKFNGLSPVREAID